MSTTAQSLFAIKAPSQPTDPAWFRAALGIVHRLAGERYTFTSDDVWTELDALNVTVHEPRALASAFLRAKGEGWIEHSGQMVKCSRSVRKGGFTTLWRSLLIEPGMAS